MPEIGTESFAHIACPRCGYPIGPTIAASETRGETSGPCTECGLHIVWESLRSVSGDPRWFVESRVRGPWTVWRAVITLARLVRPHRFWSQVSMVIPVRTRRIAVFFLAIALCLHVIAAAARITRIASTSTALTPASFAIDLIIAAALPLSRMTGSEMLKESDAVFPNPDQRSQRALHFAQSLALAGVLPFRSDYTRMGKQVTGRRVAGILLGFNYGKFSSPCEFDLIHRGEVHTLLPIASVAITAPFVVLLLPTSLRRARVRRVHLLRMSAYSTALIIPLFALFVFTPRTYVTTDTDLIMPMIHFARLNGWPLFFAAYFVMVVVSMHAMASRYLKLPHATGVAISCSLIATLTTVVILAMWFQ
jgi:hypothetical protein